jgi:ubiquinone/menaquinone biosynthesis C-methylase UbiE
MDLLQRFKHALKGQKTRPSIMPPDLLKSAIDKWSPLLGELTWHTLTVDTTIAEMSTAHFQSIKTSVDKYASMPRSQHPLRFLEVGTYAHYTGQLLVKELGVDATLSDISPKTLKYGQQLAQEQGIKNTATLVASDFHSLPFHDGFFDLVFIASAVHHTRKPEIVLKECLRVLSQHGLFILENEPCTRLFSFYQFCSNREDSFTPFEKLLAEKGLLRTVSSPFYGSRSEQLFGMVENDKIPLALYLDTLTAAADIVEISINYEACMGSLDHELMANIHLSEEDLAKFIQERLSAEFAEAQTLIGERERLLGFSLPAAEVVTAMSQRVAAALKVLPSEDQPTERIHALANIFGAALRLVAQRKDGFKPETNERFSRSMILQDQVWREEFSDNDVQIKISELLLPDIQHSSQVALFEYFVQGEWEYFQEENGVLTMLNLNVISRVKMPTEIKNVVLLVRIFTVGEVDKPYRILIFYGDRQVDNLLICQSETRLVRVFIEGYEKFLSFKLVDMNGHAVALPHHLRVSVLQMGPLVYNPL